MNLFYINENKTSIKTELFAGFSTFMTMSYVLFVIPLILNQVGMDFGSVLVATALTACISCLLMGTLGNYPFAIACGLGLNATFAYSAVLTYGYTWQEALGCVFVTGVFMLILNILGIRSRIMNATPAPLKCAITAGIGLFLTFIGFKNIGLIEADEVMLVKMGALSIKIILTLIGIIFIGAAISRGYMSSLFLTILALWGISLALGLTTWEGIVSLPPNPSATFMQLDLSVLWRPERWGIIFSMVFIMLFDSTGTVIALAEQGNFFTKDHKLPRSKRALTSDSLGTILASFLGTSNTTVFLESITGIVSGGRTGLAAVTTGLLFLIAIFFAPLAQSIPIFAIAPIHIVIGSLMLKHLAKINWNDASDFIPASLILITIPFTFSVVDGVSIGLISYPLIKLLAGKKKEISPILWAICIALILRYIFL